jgi:acyl dehydratase
MDREGIQTGRGGAVVHRMGTCSWVVGVAVVHASSRVVGAHCAL